jgi:hypothetical protein
MLGYMHYDAKKEKFQPFFEKFSKNIKRSVNINYSIREPLCHANVLKWVFTGAVWLSGCLE